MTARQRARIRAARRLTPDRRADARAEPAGGRRASPEPGTAGAAEAPPYSFYASRAPRFPLHVVAGTTLRAGARSRPLSHHVATPPPSAPMHMRRCSAALSLIALLAVACRGSRQRRTPLPVRSTATSALCARIPGQPNEIGHIPILEYHIVGDQERAGGRRARSLPARSRAAVRARLPSDNRLRGGGIEKIDLPVGTSPVVFTFDDASPVAVPLHRARRRIVRGLDECDRHLARVPSHASRLAEPGDVLHAAGGDGRDTPSSATKGIEGSRRRGGSRR